MTSWDDLSREMKTFFFVVWLSLAGVWMAVTIYIANSASAAVRQEINQKTGWDRWWSKGAWFGTSADEKVKQQYGMGGLCGSVAMCIPAILITAVVQAVSARRAATEQTRRQQREQEEIDAKARADEQTVNLAQSKRELIARLSAIDQFIRVLESESDPRRRTLTLLSAQHEITSIGTKLASGEVRVDALADRLVCEHARQTHIDLVRLGLQNDRLARDVVRIFGESADSTAAAPSSKP